MGRCGSCGGLGKVRCSSCGGTGHISRFTNSGEVEINTCLVCGGTRKIPCNFCGGKGYIGSPQSVPIPTPKSRPPGADPLDGRWLGANGSWYEFTKKGNKYLVIEATPIGKTGEGTATFKNDIARLEISSRLIGNYILELKMIDDTLKGTLEVMGIPAPMTLYRQ